MRKANLMLAAIFAALLLWCLSGCKSIEKYKASNQFATDCADKFPVKTDSLYIEGEIKHDTLITYNYGVDTLTMVKEGPEVIKYINRDRIVNKTVTIRKTDTVIHYRENTARIAAYQAEIATLSSDVAQWKGKAEKRGKQALIAISLLSTILVYSGWKIWLKVKKG